MNLRPHRARALVAALVAVAGIAHGLPASASPGRGAVAATAEEGEPLAVEVTDVEPTALGQHTPLFVRGTLRNTGTTTLTTLRLTLRLSRTLATRAEVTAWAKGSDDIGRQPIGRPTTVRGALAPGASAEFTLAVPADRLVLPDNVESPEPHGVEVRASAHAQSPSPGAAAVPTASARSFVVWQPRPVGQPVKLALLAAVTEPVAAKDAGAPTAHPARDWAATGRLARVLRATSPGGFSYAVDSALLRAAAAAAGTAANGTAANGTATNGTGTPGATTGRATPGAATGPASGPGPAATPGGGANPAAAWLQLFTATTRHRDLVALPWADPDVAAAAHADGPELVDLADTAARTTLADVLHLRAGTVLWPAKGRIDTRALHALTTRPDRPVVLDGDALPAQALDHGARVDLAVSARRRGTRVVHAVVADPGLDALVASGGTVAVPQVLAELAVTAASAPGSSLLVTTPRDWDPDPAAVARLVGGLKGAPWVRLTPFSAVAAGPAAGGTRALPVAYSRTDRRRELPAPHVAAVAVAQRRLAAFTPALVEPATVVPALREQVISLAGLGWRGRPDTQLAVARTPLTREVDALYSGISIDPGSTKNLLAKEGSLPISVRNDLPYDVHVLLVLIPRTGQLAVPNAYDLRLAAASSKAVPVKVRAVANGDVKVVASFRTPDGRTVLSSGTDIEVRVRSDWEGRGVLVIAVLLGLLLALGLARGARRGRPRIPPDAVPDPDDIGRVPVPEEGDEIAGGPADEVVRPVAAGTRIEAGHRSTAGVEVARGLPQEVTLPPVPVSTVASAPAVAAVGGRSVLTALTASAVATAPATAPRAGGPPPGPSPDRAAPGDGAHPQPQAPDGGSGGPAGASGSDTGGIVSSSAVMAAGTLLSRVLGMVRVVVLAWAIGAALSGDAFTTANTLPNSLFLLIGGGVLNAVLVPQIVAAMQRPDGGQEYVDRLLTVSLAILAVATVVVSASAPLFLRVYADWHGAQFALAAAFAFWCMPQVFFYGLYTVLGQVLNARGSFGPYMWAPVVNNVVAIAGMLVFVALYGAGDRAAQAWTPAAIGVLAGTTTLGVVAQALVLVPVLRRTGFRWRPRRGVRGVGLRAAGTVAGWTFAALLVGQLGLALLSQVVNRAGSRAGPVGAGRFVYDTAYLLFMLPHSLVAVSVVTAVFTRMSHAVVAGRLGDVRADLSVALRTTGVATVLATVAFAVLAPDLTALLFTTNGRATSEVLAWATTAMVVGLVPFSAQYLFQRVFYAFGDARTPFRVQVLVVAVWSAGNLLAGARLQGAWVVVGIGASMSLANALGAAITLVLVRRRLGGVDGRRVASTYLRCAVVAVPAGVLAWATSAAVHLLAGEGASGALLALLAGSLVLLVVYLGGLKLLRVRELDDLAAPVRRLVGA